MVDLFSGGGAGWCLAARALGIESVGIEWGAAECGTRAVVGLRTIRADVSTYPPEVFAGKVEGICGGPPCQSFSSAGKGAGLDDPRGLLVHEPLRWVRAVRPRWVALEQVPEVLVYWRSVREELRALGYSAWCGVLNTADYGVPQVRNRAVLLASLDRQAVPPAPTHSKSGADGMFGPKLLRWAAMAEALPDLMERLGWVRGETCFSSADGCLGFCTAVDAAATESARAYTQSTALGGVLRTGTRTQTGERHSDYERGVGRPAPTVRTNSVGRWMLRTPDATSIPVEAWELGVLQGFPADHRWQPPYVARQIGNAIPPPLALACLSAITGRSVVEAAA